MKYRLTETGAFQTELEYGTLTISGNSELGFRPFQLLVSSIAGCSGSVFKKILEKKKIAYDEIEIDARVERDEKQANKVTKIELQFTVIGQNLDIEQLEKSLHIASKNCSMVQSVKDAITVIEKVQILEN